ncbi:MAG TPA: endonuclease/exonuclease/phosphatase family protein [Ilumatobacteraceae bacterium]|nr:endonuclease/exonuclease/phosphatase family protein [Ilumatobacteraceae bacterium]
MAHGGKRASVLELTSWLFVAFVGLTTISQAIGWAGTTNVAVVQSLTPYLGVALVPVIAVAFWRGRLILVTVASSIAVAILVLAAPLAFPDPQPAVAADSTGLRVASLNLWYENTRIDEVDDVLAAIDADVVVFSEYTADHRKVLQASALADTYPERTDRAGRGATGVAIWSRWPLRIDDTIETFNESLDVTVTGPDGVARIVAMHMPTPLVDFDAWRADLATAAQIGRGAAGPTLLIGDLNSSYWHPDFRQLLDAGFVDANAAAGSGFSTSWPTGGIIPPFVRLDHALTTGGLVSTDVADFDVPGGDHRGLVVTVAPAR